MPPYPWIWAKLMDSRRKFIKTCLYCALSGWGAAVLPAASACNKREGNPSLLDTGDLGRREKATQIAPAQIDPDFEPPYLALHRSGELEKRGKELWNIMKSCELCPRECGVDRIGGDKGFCQASSQLEVASFHPHFGEERPLVGKGGSGTVFFSNCNLRCVFCINWEISQGGMGSPRSIDDVAEMMLKLQKMGCPNINVVTPSHYPAHIVLALDKAAEQGLRIPLVYNTCGWEKIETLKTLDGIVDIYLPDFKYASGDMAAKYSSDSRSYPELTKAGLLEMHRQVGTARPAADGLMYRGLMIRHLVMPNQVGGTKEIITWIAKNLPKDTYVNIMSQYRPMYKAFDYPKIARRLTREEYEDAVKWAKDAGLTNLDIQG
ncbi:radical SAM protein [Acidobacteriota bacterium]